MLYDAEDTQWLRDLAYSLRAESAEKFSPLKLATAERAEQLANDLEGIDTNGDNNNKPSARVPNQS